MRRSYLLASSAQGQHEVKHRPALDVVLLGGPVVVHLLPSEDQPESASGEGSETDQIISRREKESVPHATHRCWTGGIPSFSSTRSLMRSMESLGSISISISLPVSVFTLII